MKTEKAIKKCALWLSKCLEIGWDKSALNELEKLWWKYHNPNGSKKLIKIKNL